MFISNPEKLQKEYFYCGEKFGKYLIEKHQIPLLGISKNKYIFAYTISLQLTLADIPWYIRLLYK